MPELHRIPLALIDPPSLPMRARMDDTKLAELAASLREQGQWIPIGIFAKADRYEVEYGHRRYVAASMNGWADILALVYSPEELARGSAMVAENIDREGVNPAEEALYYAQLMERDHLDEAGLMARVRRSRDYIGDRWRLLQGDEQVFAAVLEEKINFATARELNKCESEEMRRYYLHQAIIAGTSSRVVRQWIDQWRATQLPPQQPAAEASPAPEAAPAPEYHLCCEFCGGDKDPWNLVHIAVHKWELDKVRAALARPVEA